MRHKWRTFLIVLMIGVAVFVVFGLLGDKGPVDTGTGPVFTTK